MNRGGFLLAVLVIILMTGSLATAQPVTWTNTAGGNWIDGASWSTSQVPLSLDQVIIGAGGAYTVTLNDAAAIGSLTIGAGTLSLNTGVLLLSNTDMKRIQVHAISSDSAKYTEDGVRGMLASSMPVFWNSSSNIIFTLDRADYEEDTDKLLLPDCVVENNKPIPACASTGFIHFEKIRQARFSQYPGKLVVYFRDGGNYSSGWGDYVMMGQTDNGINFAHEVGHYLHLVHTLHDGRNQTWYTDFYNMIWGIGTPQLSIPTAYAVINRRAGDLITANGYGIFDEDKTVGTDANETDRNLPVNDTPPDPGTVIFQHSGYNYAGNELVTDESCTSPGTVTVKDSSNTPYYLTPDRGNIMSYFKHCTKYFSMHLSPDQAKRVDQGLTRGSRRHLTNGAYPEGPAAVVTGGSVFPSIHVFARGDDWNIRNAYSDALTTYGWHSDVGLGTFTSGPAAVATGSVGSEVIHVFARADDRRIRYSAGIDTGWTGWTTQIGTKTFTSAPAAIVRPDGSINLFARGDDYNIYHAYGNGTSWSGWTSELGAGTFLSGPAAIASGNDIHVFALGPDRNILHSYWSTGPTWSGWINDLKAGTFTGPPSAVVTSNGNIHVFARGDDLNIWHSVYGLNG